MGRVRYLIIGVLLATGAVAAVVVAGGTDPVDLADIPTAEEVLADEPGPPAPPIEVEGWLNSDPLTPEDLEGQVVIYDFWTYSCVNCIRTMPYLRAWYERYRDDGLQIIGVHSPEFEFEKIAENVERASEENGVTWPVALDDEMATWDNFANRYWPAKYVYDRDGLLRFTHFGEGAYEETEDILRALLGVDPDSPRASVDGGGGDPAGGLPRCEPDDLAEGREGCQTPEVYLGADRGAATLASNEPLTGGTVRFTVPGDQPLHTVALAGRWHVESESVTAVGDSGSIVQRYEASEVNLVMAPPATGSVEVVVELDGEPVPETARGAAVTEQPDGQTTVTVDVDGLYALIAADEPGVHTLTLTPAAPGLAAFAFTFGS